MKILHINDKTTISGGVESYIRDLMPLLRKQGFETRWVALGITGGKAWVRDEVGEWDWLGADLSLAGSPLHDWIDSQTLIHVHSLSEPALLRQLFEWAPVVRHMHEPRMVCPGQGKFWAKEEVVCIRPFGLHCLKDAYVHQCCNRHPRRLLKQFASTRFEITQAASRYAAILVNSQWIREEALAGGYAPEQVRHVPYFTLPPGTATLEPEVPTIVFAGRLSRAKGVHYLLEAMAQVARAMPEVKLEILGDGLDAPAFMTQVLTLDLAGKVAFMGWADAGRVDRHLSTATVVAFPSIYPEAFGIVGIEAMMRGKPVVGFDVGGVKDWLNDGVTGFAVPVKDVDALAAGILRLLREPALRERMGQAALEDALARFSPEAHLAHLMPIYCSCLGKD